MHYSSSFYLPVIGPNIFNSTYDKTEALKYLISIYEISQGRETIIPICLEFSHNSEILYWLLMIITLKSKDSVN